MPQSVDLGLLPRSDVAAQVIVFDVCNGGVSLENAHALDDFVSEYCVRCSLAQNRTEFHTDTVCGSTGRMVSR